MKCGGLVVVSCVGHACVVLSGVWLSVGAVRLAPTHSRGFVLGTACSMATLGCILPTLDLMGTFASFGWFLDRHAELGIWACVTFVGGLLALLLPPTPACLPDTLEHIINKPALEKEEPEEETQNTHL